VQPVPGLFEAGFASSPVLMLTGQIDTPYLGKGKGFLHEAERQLEMLRTVTRRAEQVRSASEIAEVLVRVATDVQTARPQPGAVEIPIDFQYQTVDDVAVAVPARRASAPSAGSIADAARLIGETSRRVIWAGGGVVSGNAAALLQRELVHSSMLFPIVGAVVLIALCVALGISPHGAARNVERR
jgi:acetolactate synthase-1/2/3 large subunit